jgi:hypothetical protein
MKLFKKDKDGLFRSIFIAYLILILHVLLLAGVGLTVVLFKGVYLYLPWIMATIGLLVLSLAWFFYRKIKYRSMDIKSVLEMPQFQGKNVEIKLLGGLASFKIKSDNSQKQLTQTPGSNQDSQLLLEQDIDRTEEKLLKLNALYEKELITKAEFDKAKQDIIQG